MTGIAEVHDSFFNGTKSLREAGPSNDAIDQFMDIWEGRGLRPGARLHALEEAQDSADFTNLLGGVLDRELLASYQAVPKVMRTILRVKPLRDFRTVDRLRKDGPTNRLQVVKENAPYKAGSIGEKKYSYAPKKYGRVIEMSWESIKNDDLGAFTDIGDDLSQAAQNTEESALTSLFMNSSGWLASFFNAADGGSAVATAALSAANLKTGLKALATRTNTHGEPMDARAKYLMVGPDLEMTAKEILHTASLGETYNVLNEQGLTIIVNPWIPVINTTNGDTCWALFSDPSRLAAGELGLLSGHEGPELFMKSTTGSAPGQGSFENDAISWKVRTVFGETVLDTRGAYASNGQ